MVMSYPKRASQVAQWWRIHLPTMQEIQETWVWPLGREDPLEDACHVASVMPDLSWPYRLQPARLLCPWWPSGREYWSELLCPPLGDFPNPGIEPALIMSPSLAGGFLTTSTTWKAPAGRKGNPLQYSCLGNPTDRGARWVTDHGSHKESDMI